MKAAEKTKSGYVIAVLSFSVLMACHCACGAVSGDTGKAAAGAVLEMQNIAHRGMWDENVPQNTKEAVKRAYDEGATWAEADFFHTKSGQIVCIHAGKELKQYAKCHKPPRSLTPEDLATLNLAAPGSGKVFRIPVLEEVLSVVPKHCVLQAEIKGYSPTYADVFDKAVKAAGLSEKNIVISSFYYDALKDFKSRYPKYRTVWLWGFPKKDPLTAAQIIERCKAAKIDVFCPAALHCKGKLEAKDADMIRAAGIEFRVFGVNTVNTMRIAKTLGAAGFTTNYWHKAFEWAEEIGGIRLKK